MVHNILYSLISGVKKITEDFDSLQYADNLDAVAQWLA